MGVKFSAPRNDVEPACGPLGQEGHTMSEDILVHDVFCTEVGFPV